MSYTEKRFRLKSPYGYLTPKFDRHQNIWNGRIGVVQSDGRVKFRGLREAVSLPRHWREKIEKVK